MNIYKSYYTIQNYIQDFFLKIADFTPKKNLYFDIEIIVVVMVFDITMTTKVSSTT